MVCAQVRPLGNGLRFLSLKNLPMEEKMSIDLNSRIVQGLARRRFLQRSAMAVGGAALALPTLVSAKECKVTEQDILGPMYNYGAPKFQVKLA